MTDERLIIDIGDVDKLIEEVKSLKQENETLKEIINFIDRSIKDKDSMLNEAWTQLNWVKENLLDECSSYPKGCDSCVTEPYSNVLHKDSCLVYQCMRVLK